MTTIEKPAGGVVVKPRGRSRLDQLAALYDEKHAAKEAAEKELKAVTDAIKVELTQQAPGETSIDLVSDALQRPLRLLAVTSWRLNSSKMKAEEPELYVRYAEQSTAWKLSRVSS